MKLHTAADTAEQGGEQNNTATDFARYWAIAHLAGDLSGRHDYVILFEYLQDIAVLDSIQLPTEISLYQLKKRTGGNWTKGTLTSIPPKAPGSKATKKGLAGKSILGKLYHSTVRVASIAKAEGILLTDGQFNVNDDQTKRVPTHSKTCLTSISKEERDYITRRLQKELKSSTPLNLGSLHLEQTRMTAAGMREYVRGVLAEFLSDKFPDRPDISGTLLERLLERFGKLSGITPSCTSLQDLVLHKGFSKNDFTALIEAAIPAKSMAERLDGICEDLKAEGVPRRTANDWRERVIELQTAQVLNPQRSLGYDWELARKVARESSIQEYKALVDHIVQNLKKETAMQAREPLPDRELAAISIMAILDVDNKFKTVNTQSSEGDQ